MDITGAIGPREQLSAAERVGDLAGEATQIGTAAAPGIPTGGAGPDARALESLERLFVAGAQIVVQVPAFQPRSQIQPKAFRVRHAVHLAKDQAEGSSVALVLIFQARNGLQQKAVVGLRFPGGVRARPGTLVAFAMTIFGCGDLAFLTAAFA